MSEKKMTDEELAKISGGRDKGTAPKELDTSGGGHASDAGDVTDNDAPGQDVGDFQQT